MEEKFINSFDNTQIWTYTWNDVKNPKGIVQIFHGMSEHAKRYEDFAKFLNKNGYIVFADDHRGHGKTAGEENLGKYDGSDIFYDTLQDEIFFSEMLKEKYNLPLFVFGHSYGSFIAQAYIQRCTLAKAVIICGSANMGGRLDVKLGKLIAKITAKIKGKDAPAKMINKMTFGAYDKAVKNGSWLNTDEEAVKKYYADPLRGKICSAKFYVDFFHALEVIYHKENTKRIPENFPVYIIAGKNDPVGKMGKLVVKLFKLYHELCLNVSMTLYDNARHEILNEPIKQTVYEDVFAFIEKNNE